VADQIYADGPIATPATYEVPGSAQIVPIAVQALLNGSGASGDFVPTLIFRSQAGHVIARVPTTTTVKAGSSAEVTWAPFLRGAGAAAAAGLDICIAKSFEPYTIAANGGALSTRVLWETVTPATGTFVWPSGAHSDRLAITRSGLYVCLYSHITVASWPLPASGFVVSEPSATNYGAGFANGGYFLNNTTSALFAALSNRPYTATSALNLPAADDYQLFVGTTVAAGFSMQITTMMLVRIGDYISGAPI
jgi:hypothetical protein